MLIEIAKQQLRKAGWYEGRKICLLEYEKGYKEAGCEFLPSARKFLEEFGDLDIQDKYIDPFAYKDGVDSISINESMIDVPHCCFKPNQEIIKKVGQKIVPIGLYNHGNIYMYMSEDGKIYSDWYFIGLRAENTEQFWNEYYGEDYGWASWDELKAGKGRTMKKKEIKKYI